MSDDLTVRITRVLAEHVRVDDDPNWAALCSCRIGGEVRALDEAPAWHRAHQAEQVRAVLGETSVEWGVLRAEVERLRAGIEVERFIVSGAGLNGVAARLGALLKIEAPDAD